MIKPSAENALSAVTAIVTVMCSKLKTSQSKFLLLLISNITFSNLLLS